MRTSPRTRRLLRVSVYVGFVSAFIGVALGLLLGEGQPVWILAVSGAATGVIIGVGGTTVENLVLTNPNHRRMRRLPPAALVLLRAVAFSVIIFIGLSAPPILLGGPPAWTNPDFRFDFAISALVAMVFSIALEVVRHLGAEAAVSLFTGRYNKPRLETRIVLFADLVGSTALAERLGPLRFHEYLGEVAQDLAGPVYEAGGDVHRYVGDEVIVTWPLKKGVQNAACLDCATAMHAALSARGSAYQSVFGLGPKIRIAIHAGEVAAGEIGDWKKEIALLGDTMNTTARIEAAAREFSVNTVVSDDVASLLSEERRATLSPSPAYKASGKREALTLWSGDSRSVRDAM